MVGKTSLSSPYQGLEDLRDFNIHMLKCGMKNMGVHLTYVKRLSTIFSLG